MQMKNEKSTNFNISREKDFQISLEIFPVFNELANRTCFLNWATLTRSSRMSQNFLDKSIFVEWKFS